MHFLKNSFDREVWRSVWSKPEQAISYNWSHVLGCENKQEVYIFGDILRGWVSYEGHLIGTDATLDSPIAVSYIILGV